MDGVDFIRSLAALPLEAREQALLDAARTDALRVEWVPLSLGSGRLDVLVSSDAIRIGHTRPVRINVSPTLQQRIADVTKSVLLTTKLSDLVWKSGVQVPPRIQPSDPAERKKRGYSPSMSDVEAMLRHDSEVAATLTSAAPGALVGQAGKNWVLSNVLLTKQAANYGWYSAGAPYTGASGLRMWQTLGTRHGRTHVDYSQTCRLVQIGCRLDGVARDIRDIGSDPTLASMLSSEGFVKAWRIPGVPAPDGSIPVPAERMAPTEKLPAGQRELRRGDVGDDVRTWQRFLAINADGIFGRQTEGATKAFQQAQGISAATGTVTAETRAAADRVQRARVQVGMTPDEDLIDTFSQARNYTKANRKPGDVKWLVLHSMEASEKPTTAEAVAAWFAGPSAPRASAHFNVDANSCAQSVREEDVAWAAPGANAAGLHIEHAGFARQSRDEWMDDYSMDMLKHHSAPLAAYLCKKWGIPVEYVDRRGLLAGKTGITTHNEVSHAFKKSNHTDPGSEFPMDEYLEMVRAA